MLEVCRIDGSLCFQLNRSNPYGVSAPRIKRISRAGGETDVETEAIITSLAFALQGLLS